MSDTYLYFYLYISAVVALVLVAASCIYRKRSAGERWILQLTSAVVAVSVTWYCILVFFFNASREKDRFVLAYQQVSDDPFGWIWSSMLLSWALTAAYAVPVFATINWWELLIFLALGEMMAISGAFPLLFIFAGRPDRNKNGASPLSLIFVLIGHVAIWAGRRTVDLAFESASFTVALAILHLAILLPAFLPRMGSLPPKLFLIILASLSALQHLCALLDAWNASPSSAAFLGSVPVGLGRNLCQFSIGCDGVFAHFQSQLFLGHSLLQVIVDTGLGAVFSPGSIFAWRLAALAEGGGKNM